MCQIRVPWKSVSELATNFISPLCFQYRTIILKKIFKFCLVTQSFIVYNVHPNGQVHLVGEGGEQREAEVAVCLQHHPADRAG
jgi:hypothetical protein